MAKNYIKASDALDKNLRLEVAPYASKEVIADKYGRYVGQVPVDNLELVGTGKYIDVTDWDRLGDGYSIVTNPYQAASAEQVSERKNRDQVGTNPNDISLMNDEAYARVLQAQKDWEAAKARGDQVGMDAAHAAAEAERAKYGYSGGADGSAHLGLMTYTGNNGKANRDESGGNYDNNGYSSRYQERIDALTDAILNREAFFYDKEQDPLYHQYRDSYTRNGQKAMQDTLAQVSARTGGLASSYAQGVAQQAFNDHMAALDDKVIDLQQLAYGMYMDDLNADRTNLQMLLGLDDSEYNRWLTDRNFDYGAYRDSVADRQWAEQQAYQQAQDALAQQNWQTQWDYQLIQDELARQDALAQLQAAAENNFGYRYTSTPVEDDGVISVEMLSQMQAKYPDGNMPEEAWTAAVGLYGEEAMRNAGFRQQAQPQRETRNYQRVVNQLNSMKRSGVSGMDILYDLEDAYKNKLLSREEYLTLKGKFEE